MKNTNNTNEIEKKDRDDVVATNGRCTHIPWVDILKNVGGFIDPGYLLDYNTLDSDPLHLSMLKVKKLFWYWFDWQKSGQITFVFTMFWQGLKPSWLRNPKGFYLQRSWKAGDDPKQNRVTKKKGNHSKKDKACSREIISDLGWRIWLQWGWRSPLFWQWCQFTSVCWRLEVYPCSWGPSNLWDYRSSYTWRKAPANLSMSKIDIWNRFTKNLPKLCLNWTHEQAMLQFQVFKGWSINFPSPKKDMHLTTQNIPDDTIPSVWQVHSMDIPGEIRGIQNAGLGDVDIHHLSEVSLVPHQGY